MEMDFCGPSSPPWFGQSAKSKHGSHLKGSDHTSEQLERMCLTKAKKHSDRSQHKVRAKYISQSSSSEESESSVQVKKSAQPKRATSEQDKHQTDPDSFYRGGRHV